MANYKKDFVPSYVWPFDHVPPPRYISGKRVLSRYEVYCSACLQPRIVEVAAWSMENKTPACCRSCANSGIARDREIEKRELGMVPEEPIPPIDRKQRSYTDEEVKKILLSRWPKRAPVPRLLHKTRDFSGTASIEVHCIQCLLPRVIEISLSKMRTNPPVRCEPCRKLDRGPDGWIYRALILSRAEEDWRPRPRPSLAQLALRLRGRLGREAGPGHVTDAIERDHPPAA